jgi:Fungal N-terminal domain of STAND proteins
MDPLSIATASATLAAFAFKLGRGLNDCIDQVRSAKDALIIFSAELSSLGKTLLAVKTSMEHSNLLRALQKAVAAEHARTQLENLHEILRDCKTTFQDLEAFISGIKSGKFA